MSSFLHFFFKYLIIPLTIIAYLLNVYYKNEYSTYAYLYNILLTGSIGFYTNFIAIKLLFHPKKKTLLFRLQGLLPKEKEKIAVNIGKGVEEQFFNSEIILKHINKNNYDIKLIDYIFNEIIDNNDSDSIKKIGEDIKNKNLKIRNKNKIKIKNLKNFSFNNEEIKNIKEYLQKEKIVLSFIKEILPKIKDFGVNDLIESEIKGFDSNEFEKEAKNISRKHLKIIEISGGILGLFAGIAIFNIKIFLISVLIIGFLFGLDLLLTKRCKKM